MGPVPGSELDAAISTISDSITKAAAANETIVCIEMPPNENAGPVGLDVAECAALSGYATLLAYVQTQKTTQDADRCHVCVSWGRTDSDRSCEAIKRVLKDAGARHVK